MRDLFLHDMKVISNMTLKKRYQNYNLDGHTDHITAIDAKNGVICSGSRDTKVKVWDIDRKKGWTFEGKHSAQVNKVLIWDEFSVFSASVDKSIRYFDIRDWGNPNENFTEDSKCENGYHFSKHFIGHKASVTQLKRLNNSHTRLVSASLDSTVKIWDIHANEYCDLYSNSNVVGHKSDKNTEVVEPLYSLEGDHAAGVKVLAMN
jgi:WD40 repeat protein